MIQKKYKSLFSLSLLITCFIQAGDEEKKPLLERYDSSSDKRALVQSFLLTQQPTLRVDNTSTITREGFFEVLPNQTIRRLKIDTGEVTNYPSSVPAGSPWRLGIGYEYFYALYGNGIVYAVPKKGGPSKKILSGVHGTLFDVEANANGTDSIYYVPHGQYILHKGTHSSLVPFEIDLRVDLSKWRSTMVEVLCCFLPCLLEDKLSYRLVEIENITTSGDICRVQKRYLVHRKQFSSSHFTTFYREFTTDYDMATKRETVAKSPRSKAHLSPGGQLNLDAAMPLTALIAYAESNPAILEIISLAEAAQSNQSFISGAQLTPAQQEALEHPIWRLILKKYIN